MNWVQHINQALKKARSRHSTSEVMGWILSGEATLWVGDQMTASARPHQGKAQIVHCAGRWNLGDADWIRGRFRDWMRDRDLNEILLEGRPGWGRFLQQKEFRL